MWPGSRSTDREGNSMHVHNVLTVKGSAVATIAPDASLGDATASLRDHGVGALVVSRDGRTIEGIISERDVVRALAAHGASTLGHDVLSAMSTSVTTCRREDTIDQMMAMMNSWAQRVAVETLLQALKLPGKNQLRSNRIGLRGRLSR